MAEVFFYHLTRTPLEATLRVLVEKSRGQGWRVAVRARTEDMVARLDAALWLGPEEGFLPHGVAGGDHDADQPVLLGTGAAGNAPDCLVSVEGAALTAAEIAPLTRAMVLFDGQDAAAVQTAREQWKTLTAAGLRAKYWSEDAGRWEMKAESAGSGANGK